MQAAEIAADNSNDMSDSVDFGRRKRREAVSDKPFDPNSIKLAKKVPKSDDARQRIAQKLKANFLFSHLTDEGIQELVDVVEERQFPAGTTIIQQGAEGDFFYIIDDGRCDIFVGETKVLSCGPGESFGELALMYGAPRAATVVSVSPMRCWAMDRDTFKYTLMNHIIKKRDMYEAFLREVPLLGSLLEYERLTLADALKPEKFNKGEYIVKQGEEGDTFYIVENGKVKVEKDGKDMGVIESGGYFGELALLTRQPRAASIRALTDTTVLSIDRKAFTNILGPLHNILKRKANKYENYLNEEFSALGLDEDEDDE